MREYPKGTWIATTRIDDEEEIERALNGEYNGYSITTVSKKFADRQMQLPRRVLMKDIKEPVGFTISLVRNPCVKGAKFCSMKEDCNCKGDVVSENLDDKLEEETKGFVQSIKGILGKDDKKDKKDDDEEIEIDVEAIVNEVTKDFLTNSDFESFKEDLRKELNEKFETLGTELFKAIRKSLEKEEEEEEEDNKPHNEGNGESDENGGEDENDDNGDAQEVQSSKSIPNHDINNGQSNAKTGAARVYEIMGRDNTGSALKRQ